MRPCARCGELRPVNNASAPEMMCRPCRTALAREVRRAALVAWVVEAVGELTPEQRSVLRAALDRP